MPKKTDYVSGVPMHSIESLARYLLPQMQKYFNSEEGKREFEKWKAEQAQVRREDK
ncbi:MAG: hypothetical protein FWD05_10390 [Oscillospiraceae bacterium]|nr:hypothetical protein [Oscillospiraceae bacterium]